MSLVAALLTVTAPAASAADDGVSDLLAALGASPEADPTHNLAAWTSGLGEIGELGERLPLVAASPGGLLGFHDLVKKAVAEELAGADTFGDLEFDDDVLEGDDRQGHLTTTVEDAGNGKRLDLVLTAERTVDGEDLHLADSDSKVDLTVSDGITVKLASRLALSLVWTGDADDKVYLVSEGDTPRLDVDATASIDPAAAEAAVGILGVSLDGSDLDLEAHFVGKVSDPDNDGKLFFTEHTEGDGELAQDGSPEGLFSAGLDPEGSQPIDDSDPGSRGSVNATFQLGAAEAVGGLDLKDDVNATVTVDWPDIGSGGPTVTAPGLADSVGKFGNMSMQDLGEGLAQVVAALTAIQRSKFDPEGPVPEIGDFDLPFMRGTLSDAIQVNERLKELLAENTVPAPNHPDFDPEKHDPAQEGKSDFSSLQDLLQKVDEAPGITVDDLGWVTADSKLSMTLAMKKSPPADAVPIDELSAAASGIGKTYDDDSVTVEGTPWNEGQWIGRRVTAGTSSGEVASNEPGKLTLTGPWIGGTPADGTSFVISGAEAHPGAVSFANELQEEDGDGAGHGIVNANAEQTFAEVTPSFDAEITLVLDLQDPVEGEDCKDFEDNTKACPFTDDDGAFHTHVESLPLNTDRVMIRTGKPLFEADFPIETKVDVDANAGFFKVQLDGELKMCHSALDEKCSGDASPDDGMLSVALKELGDEQHDIRVGTLFKTLVDDPGSLLDIDTNIRAFGVATVSLPEADDFLPDGAAAKFTATQDDLADPATIDFDTSGLSEIIQLDFDPDDPKALFGALIKTLQTLSEQLASADSPKGSNVFGKQIPGLGRSLRDLLLSDESNGGEKVEYTDNSLIDGSRSGESAFTDDLVGRTVVVGTQIGVVDTVPNGQKLTMTKDWDTRPADGATYAMRTALDDAIDQLLALPPDNIQDAVKMLNTALGAGDSVGFRYLETGEGPNLVLEVDWLREYHTASPIRLDLPAAGETFAGAEATGMAQIAIKGHVDIGVVIPLKPGDGPGDGAALQILEDSSIGVGAKATFNGVVKGMIGPLSLALGDPTSGADDDAVAEADLSLDLKKPGDVPADSPVSFNSFIGDVDVTFNATSGTVDCGGDSGQMVCADLPMFLNLSGAADDWEPLGDIKLNIPKSSTPADLFDLGEPNLEIPDLDALEDALNDVVLDLLNFGDGFESYLAKIERAMALASFKGKLPLIGDDLQQGSEFIGDLRNTLRTEVWDKLPGNGRPDDQEALDNLNKQIETALADAGLGDADVKLGFACDAVLKKVGTPSLNTDIKEPGEDEDPTPTADYQYKIVAFQDSGDTVPSNPSAKKEGAATLGGESKNTVKWNSVEGATGYKVLRSKNGGAFRLVKTLNGKGNTEYIDRSNASGTVYGSGVDKEPELDNCPGADMRGVDLDFTLKRGEVSPGKGCSDTDKSECFGDDIGLDIGIPGLALRQGANGDDGIHYDIGYELHFSMSLTKKNGFLINTHDGWDGDGGKVPSPEVQFGLGFDLPDTMQAELAFIEIDVDKTAASKDIPLFAGAVQIDLKSDQDEAGCFTGDEASACSAKSDATLSFADLATKPLGDLVGVRFDGGFHLDWDIKARATSALPGVAANFQLMWEISNKSPEGYGAPATIAFNNVELLAGEFFDHLLGPVVELVKKVTGPVQPVIDTLYAEIPLISDLSKMAGGDPVTLVSLAQEFNILPGEASLKFVETVKHVLDFLTRIPSCEDDCSVSLGSFTLVGEKALNTSNSPATADSMYDGEPDAKKGEEVRKALNKAAGDSQVFTTENPGTGDTTKAGLTFPIIDEPAQVFSLLMGGDVDLVEFDSGKLELGFAWKQSFGPVYAPPPVFVTLSGAASVSLQMKAGLDTHGIRKAVEALRAKDDDAAVEALDGLYFETVDANGKPLPVVTLSGEIAAGASVSVLIVSVGLEGGLSLTISFHWNDPNNDGKFRVTEFGHAVMNNPLCLFTMSGELALFLRLNITVGVSIFSKTFNITLVDVTLLDFTVSPDCEPPPPKLGGVDDDTLVVFAGKFGTEQFRKGGWGNEGLGADDEEVVKVIQLHYAQTEENPTGDNGAFDGIAVEAFGERREYIDKGLERVVVDGSGVDHKMVVTFTADGEKKVDASAGDSPAEFTKEAVVIGGENDDQITTGRGLSFVDGRGGGDTIVTGDTGGDGSKVMVAGGAGADKIAAGNGDNRVAGDSSLGDATFPDAVTVTHHPDDRGEDGDEKTASLSGAFDWTEINDPTGNQLADATDGADTVNVGLGKNTVFGNGGADRITVASDLPDGTAAQSNTLVGGSGDDSITGGSAGDRIYTAAKSSFVTVTDGKVGDGVDDNGPADDGAVNVVHTGEGNDIVWGSTGRDLVSGGSTDEQRALIFGGKAEDILSGGFGRDEIYGGPGDDYVIAEPAEVSGTQGTDEINGVEYGPKRTVTKLPLPEDVEPSDKILVGGLGNDHIIGGDGTTTVFGDKLIDGEKCKASDPVASDPVAESTNPDDDGDGNDLILGGAGVDTVSAGGGDDIANVFGNDDLACGQQGKDTLRGGTDDDQLWGGSAADVLYGGPGADHVFGNNGGDTGFGGSANDVIEGNNGSDWASGGAGDDAVFGGTRAKGSPDSGDDDLYGDTGADHLIGDNGDPVELYPFDLDGETPAAGAGDRVHGGSGEDRAYGGLGDDIVNGNAGDDYLEGNNGSDAVHGNADEDRIIGGSSQQASEGVGRPDDGDRLFGDAGPDLVAGDNAALRLAADPDNATRVTRMRGFGLLHQVQLLDLGLSPAAATSGNDYVDGGSGQDVAYGQAGDDRIKGNDGDDYGEGGQGIDWVEGDLGHDDLVGGSSTPLSGSGEQTEGQLDEDDALFGGPGDDVSIGDNGQVVRPLDGQGPTRSTVRMSTEPGEQMAGRVVHLYDRNGADFLTAPPADRFGADRVSGGSGVDVLYGQDGGDYLSGGAHGDYLQGNGAGDVMRGDLSLDADSDQTTVVPLDEPEDPGWPGSPSEAASLEGSTSPDGQDDMIGGSGTPAFRDGDDVMQGDGADDVQLADNGTLVRTIEEVDGVKREKVYTDRYPNGSVPDDATRSRTHDPDRPGPSTRFCTTDQDTCEPGGAFGDDTMFGDGGNDGMWGQDGDDSMRGNDGDDDMFGELGADTMFGDSGEDAMLGDRGGVVNQFLDEGDKPETFTVTLKQVPQESFTAFRRDLYDRRVDLLHDVDGQDWVGGPTENAMTHDGITTGGDDRIRGGLGNDRIHAGFGEDLANGDSGGDRIFGDDGNDALWGGKGCDPVSNASTADCQAGGEFDPHARGENDRFVDHTFGGEGDDILDFNPRGSFPGDCAPGSTPETTGKGKNAVTIDPCEWFTMTDEADGDVANNQHHHGTDWMYGGWDRDVMQGNVSDNGPNPGDRMIDWNGAYNLYTHCNAAYGGHNDIRQHSPDMQNFLTELAWSDGAGQTAGDVTTEGTSAYRELALTYQSDFKEHGVGPAFPGTPGHFDQPEACEG